MSPVISTSGLNLIGLNIGGYLFFDLGTGYTYLYGSAVRPVISLKPDAITGGDGTMNNPFTVN